MRIIHYLTMCTDGCQAAEYSCKTTMAINNIRMRSYYSLTHLSDNFYHRQRIERLSHICNITGISTVFQFVEINRMRANDRLLNSFLFQPRCKHLKIPLDTTCALKYMSNFHCC